MHLPPIPRFLARWSIRAVMAALFLGLPATLFYLREYGVGLGLKEQVAAALSGKEFSTHIGKLSLDPFSGLVAERVEVVEVNEQKRNLARIARLVVSVNLTDLLARKISIDHIELEETDVSIPLGSDPEATRLNFNGVSGQCLFYADQIRISTFEAKVQGIKIVLSGLLRNPQAFHLDRDAARSQSHGDQSPLNVALEHLAALKYPGVSPEIRAEINGDLADLSSLVVAPISLRSGPIVAPKWRVESLEIEADFKLGVLAIRRLALRDREGALNASGQWQKRMVNFEVSSSISPSTFFGLLSKNPALESLKFRDVAEFAAAGHADFSTSPIRYHATGSARLGKFSWRGVKFDAFSTSFAVRDGIVFARDAHLVAGNGKLEADFFLAPGDVRLRLTNTITPTLFIPMLGPKEQEFLKLMEFKDQPFVQIELKGPKLDIASLSGTGFLRIGRTAMRGSWLDWGQSKLEIADRAVTYRDFSLGRGQAMGSGTFVYDFGRHEVVLRDIDSTMPPVDVMMWVDPKIAEALKPYRFNQPPKVRGGGLVHMFDIRHNNLLLKVEAAEGLEYDLLNRTLKFGRTLADVHIDGSKVRANVKSAKLMGGEVGVKAVISIDQSDPTFGSDVDIRRVNFAQLTKLYFDYDDSKGIGSGRFQFTSRFGQEEKMRGTGSVKVEDGQVFAIPILGPLSEIINKIIPGAGLHRASLATADFQVADEKIMTQNLAIEGAGFSLFGKGDIFFTTDKMDLSVRINARGLPGIVLFPVSKLFEYVSTGTVSEPEWRAKIIPRFGNGE